VADAEFVSVLRKFGIFDLVLLVSTISEDLALGVIDLCNGRYDDSFHSQLIGV
jgi:hypothetical protein